MKLINEADGKKTNYRWVICAMLFFATTINYLDRQVLSLTISDIESAFHWSDKDYGKITSYFSLFYALCMLLAGRFVDWLDTKKGFLWAIGIWSVGACLHTFCGIAAAGFITGEWFAGFAKSREIIAGISNTSLVASTTVSLFMFARAILALGEAGNFPAAIKATAEYFPKKDRAFATSIFNSGATIGAMIAPVSIIPLAAAFGWEAAFFIIGMLGFVWMGFWIFIYKKPEKHKRVNQAELQYILSDKDAEKNPQPETAGAKEKVSFLKCFKYKQTWAFALGKFMTDGVWWFYLFWMPKYLKDVCGLTKEMDRVLPLTILYTIVMLSLYGGKLPTIIMNKTGKNPYAARMQAMLIFAFFPLPALLAQPLGNISYWFPVIIIGIACAAHQSWSANIFSTVGDMFPKKAVATITGIGGMAGGMASFLINNNSGKLFEFADKTKMQFLGFEGKPAGYFIIFCICSVAYLLGWIIMKSLVPKYKPITDL